MASQPPADVTTIDVPAPNDIPAENSPASLAALYKDDPAKEAPVDAPVDDQATQQDEEPPVDDAPVEDQPPIEAPLSWAKDAKDVFAALPREAQEIVARRERDRDVFVRTKANEAAQTRQTVENEARDTIRRQAENYAQQLETYLPQIAATPPDIRYLQSENPEHHAIYNEQDRQYRLATAQRENLTHQAQLARQQAEQVANEQMAQSMEVESRTLEEKLGSEWSDPSARAKLLGDLEPIAAELGYSQEVMAQAGSADILALRTALDWKRKAEKFDQQNKAKMIPVRDARQAPPAARPGAPAAQGAPKSTLEMLYPNDVRR